MIKSAIILLLLFAVTALEGQAGRTCRIVFPLRPPDAPEEAFLYDGTASHKVALPTMNFSDVIHLPEGKIHLKLAKQAVSSGAMPLEGIPQVELPEEVKDVYLVIQTDPSNADWPLRMTVLDGGNERVKPGHTLWLNLSGCRIEGEMGTRQFSIAPGEQAVSLPPLESSGYYKAEFRYQPDPSGPFVSVMKKSWWLDIQSKNLGFIMPSHVGVPRIFTFRDHRMPSGQ